MAARKNLNNISDDRLLGAIDAKVDSLRTQMDTMTLGLKDVHNRIDKLSLWVYIGIGIALVIGALVPIVIFIVQLLIRAE